MLNNIVRPTIIILFQFVIVFGNRECGEREAQKVCSIVVVYYPFLGPEAKPLPFRLLDPEDFLLC